MDLRMESQSRPLRLLEEKLTAPNSLTGLEVIGTHLASLNQSFVLPTLFFFFFSLRIVLFSPWLAARISCSVEPGSRTWNEDVLVWMNTVSTYKCNKGKALHKFTC